MNKILFCYLLFFIYSFMGWIIENTYCSICNKKLILNRGFLIGPYIPVYGTAALLMTIFLDEYKNNLFVLFSMSTIYASVLEYITSFIMEKAFNARWWDYSDKLGNINGRVCLKNSLLFGICGVLIVYLVHPFILNIINMFDFKILNVISLFLGISMLIDFIISTIIVLSLKLKVKNINKDLTEEIDRQVKEKLYKRNVFHKRIFNAFPKLSFINDKSGIVIESIKARLQELDKNLEKKKEEIKNIKTNIKNIRKTSNNINLLNEEKIKLKNIRRSK